MFIFMILYLILRVSMYLAVGDNEALEFGLKKFKRRQIWSCMLLIFSFWLTVSPLKVGFAGGRYYDGVVPVEGRYEEYAKCICKTKCICKWG